MSGKRVKPKAFSSASEAWRRENVGRMIFEATRVIERDLLKALTAQGYPAITMVHLNLYRNLDMDGNRLTELASRANMTKQGMQELVDRAEALGFIERRADPHDGRAKAVSFSKDGLLLLDAIRNAVSFVEEQMAERIGKAGVKEIGRLLRQYNESPDDRAGTAVGSGVRRRLTTNE
jgi:DNA-binding MarR family transcriptional regulator